VVSPYDFFKIATDGYANSLPDQKCSRIIHEGFGYIEASKTQQDIWEEIRKAFNVCDPITKAEDLEHLYHYLDNGFTYMAMTNYPYETSFLEPMPAWPVDAACKNFKDLDPPSA